MDNSVKLTFTQGCCLQKICESHVSEHISVPFKSDQCQRDSKGSKARVLCKCCDHPSFIPSTAYDSLNYGDRSQPSTQSQKQVPSTDVYGHNICPMCLHMEAELNNFKLYSLGKHSLNSELKAGETALALHMANPVLSSTRIDF